MNEMPQDATLSPTQTAALAELLAGRTVTDAAKAVGVGRETLHRWLKSDYVFRAQWNQSRRELLTALQHRLLSLAEKAAECIARAIDQGDAKAALALLRALPSATPSIGSEDAAELAENARIWEDEKQSRLERRRILAGFA
jgi:hypothetical protein